MNVGNKMMDFINIKKSKKMKLSNKRFKCNIKMKIY